MRASSCDIAVVGAGLVGLSVCALLQNQGYRVTVIDAAAEQPTLPEPYDIRTYALTPASMRLFDRLGVGGAMRKSRIAQFRGMRVWDADSNGAIEFSAAALGRERLGYIVEHSNLMCALNAVLALPSAVTYVTGRVPSQVGIADARDAARLTAISLLASLKAEIGDLDRVRRIVRVFGMVNSEASFTEQPKVINGCSDLLVELWGDRGRHARAAVGMVSLPIGITVEIEMVVEIVE